MQVPIDEVQLLPSKKERSRQEHFVCLTLSRTSPGQPSPSLLSSSLRPPPSTSSPHQASFTSWPKALSILPCFQHYQTMLVDILCQIPPSLGSTIHLSQVALSFGHLKSPASSWATSLRTFLFLHFLPLLVFLPLVSLYQFPLPLNHFQLGSVASPNFYY